MIILVCDDDNRYCQKVKENVLSSLDEESEAIVEIFNSAKALVSFCLENEPDIIFLDIELGDMNGIDLAKYLRSKYPAIIIIYITNYPNYVFSCFDTEPLGFLRKPIDIKEFNITFKRIVKKYTEIHKCIPIKWQNDSINLEIKKICYIEGYNRHLVFHLINEDTYEIVGKINELYNKLIPYGFIKTHQGFIVNMLHIKKFGENEIYMSNGDIVLMSVRRKLKTKEAYSDYINRRDPWL